MQSKDTSYMIKDVLNVQINSEGANFLSNSCFQWKIGNGELILFLEDSWHRNGILKDFLPRLYRISRL